MENLIIVDNLKKESKTSFIWMIVCFIFDILIPVEYIFGRINIIFFVLSELILILVSIFLLIDVIRKCNYKLFVNNEKIVLKTLTKRYEVRFDEINAYICINSPKGELFGFGIYYKEKKLLIYTRCKNSLEKLLKENTNITEIRSDDPFDIEFKKNNKTIKTINLNVWIVFSYITFWLTLASPIIAIAIVVAIGEVEVFNVLGMVKNLWIMLLFIPIGICSILVGIKLRLNYYDCKKNFIIAGIIIPLLIIFGSIRFSIKGISYDNNKINEIKEITKLELPDDVKVATMKILDYNQSYAKITNNESKNKFEQEIQNNKNWKTNLTDLMKSTLNLSIQIELDNFDYFVIYNVTHNIYNNINVGENECVFIAYDKELSKFIIIDSMIITGTSK